MIGNPSRHRRSALHPPIAVFTDPQLQAQALMLATEVVDAAHQIHQGRQCLWVLEQGSSAASQAGQAERKVAFKRSIYYCAGQVGP
jgi:hypothetical protein